MLGGGAGGVSCSADLSMIGHRVNLFELPQFREPHISAIQKSGKIEAKGLIEEAIRPNIVTTSIKRAIKGVDIVLIVTPGYGIETFCKLCMPYLEEGQVVIFHGKGGHTLEFMRILNELRRKKKVTLGETHTLPYSTRFTGEGQITIAIRNRILLSSAFPSKDTPKIVAVLEELYPPNQPYKYKIIPAENVLAVTLCDLNAMVHPVLIIFNLSLVESEKIDFRVYLDGATPSISKIKDRMENERLAIMRGFGLKPVPMETLRYPDEQMTQAEKELRTSFRERAITRSTTDRFIIEDVPCGLVTIASLADMVSVQSPIIDAVIKISSVINGVDYFREGRTVEKLGIARLSLLELQEYLNNGESVGGSY